MEANGYRNVLSLKMFGLGLPMMLKEYGMNYEKRHTKQGIQTNLSLKEKATATGCRSATNPPRLNSLRPATAGLFVSALPQG
jgi:phage/plasmid-associated DNA primase